jgi:hypothetical protein
MLDRRRKEIQYKPIFSYDMHTMEIIKHKSVKEAAKYTGCTEANCRKSVNQTRVTGGRWIMGYTMDQLADNISRNALT